MNGSLPVFGHIFHSFIRFARTLVGEIIWRPPGWAGAVRTGAQKRPWLMLALSAGLLVLLVGGGWLWNWYAHLPKPPSVGWIVNLGDVPGTSVDFQPQYLTLTFDRSVAKLEDISKDVTPRVTLTPRIKGVWSWSNGSQLLFVPTEDWPADTKFRVDLDRSLFTSHARLETLTKEFHTQPFTVAITEPLFYVNPKNTEVKQITATLTFSHPVNRAALEKNLTLAMESGEQVFQNAPSDTGRCSVTYDMRDRIAYIRSVNVTVPQQSGHAILTVPDVVTAINGGAHLEAVQRADVLVPSVADLFHISSAQVVIAANREGEPEQALVLNSSVGVKPELLAKAVHAWILPKPKEHYDAESETKINAWQSPAEITDAILAKSTPVTLTLVPREEEYATLHSFKLKVPENAFVYVTIDKGLPSIGGAWL
ncbi:MAG: Ig-like domain-containing protein, partial [Methylacidiphilales bacterium]|nr:Ig-like domain-containing protein [Candidatus Methylacidiphilales bacterium]